MAASMQQMEIFYLSCASFDIFPKIFGFVLSLTDTVRNRHQTTFLDCRILKQTYKYVKLGLLLLLVPHFWKFNINI